MLKFSVIIPCYHDEEKLVVCWINCKALLHRPWEIIVVDGAGNARMCEICAISGARKLVCDLAAGSNCWLVRHGRKAMFVVLHADAQLSADPLTAMTKALRKAR